MCFTSHASIIPETRYCSSFLDYHCRPAMKWATCSKLKKIRSKGQIYKRISNNKPCFDCILSVLGMKHFSQQWVAGKISQQVALIQVFLHLQADAAYLWQTKQQLSKLVRMTWVGLHSVVHQSPVYTLLCLFYLPSVLHWFNIWLKNKKNKHELEQEYLKHLSLKRNPPGLKRTRYFRHTNSSLSSCSDLSLETRSWALDTRLLRVTPAWLRMVDASIW